MPTRRLGLTITGIVTVAIGSGCGISTGAKPSIPTATGFRGNSTQHPVTGTWRGIARTISTLGYLNEQVGHEVSRRWQIARNCVTRGACSYTLTRELGHEP